MEAIYLGRSLPKNYPEKAEVRFILASMIVQESKAKLVNDVAFTKRHVYFFVTYPDVEMCYPLIESYVYLGMNLSDEDLEDTWYFQWASDFSKHGSALEGTQRPVFCAKKDELHEFQNAKQLTSTMELAAAKRAANRRTG